MGVDVLACDPDLNPAGRHYLLSRPGRVGLSCRSASTFARLDGCIPTSTGSWSIRLEHREIRGFACTGMIDKREPVDPRLWSHRQLMKPLGGTQEGVIKVPMNLGVGLAVGRFQDRASYTSVETSRHKDGRVGLGIQNSHLGALVVATLGAGRVIIGKGLVAWMFASIKPLLGGGQAEVRLSPHAMDWTACTAHAQCLCLV